MHRFYVPEFVIDHDVDLSDEEAHHLSRVLRLGRGDHVAIFDGRGHEALARVEAAGPRRVIVRPTGSRQAAPEPSVALTLAQAMLKSDKMEAVIRDAVMLGVAAVQPFLSSRTEVPRSALSRGRKRERWDRTVIASVKQCGRAVVPAVLDPIDFDELIAASSGQHRLMFVEPSASGRETMSLRTLEGHVPTSAMILIGPEGGWEPGEVQAAISAGVTIVSAGGLTLRADAAGAAALVLLQFIWRDR